MNSNDEALRLIQDYVASLRKGSSQRIRDRVKGVKPPMEPEPSESTDEEGEDMPDDLMAMLETEGEQCAECGRAECECEGMPEDESGTPEASLDSKKKKLFGGR
jgi:hypothetical protein